MASITQKTMELLDRLFNLKSDENVILSKINQRINETRESIEKTTEEQKDSEVKKLDAEGKLSVFKNQQETFQSAFEGLDDETFAALRDIDVNVEIGTMLEKVEKRAPEYIDDLERIIHSYQESIDAQSNAKKELESVLKGLEEDKAKSEDDRTKLTSLLEQSLSSDEIERESLTASYVKKILALFGVFSEEEIKELSKLIIFPDEGLYDYQASYEERKANGFPKSDNTQNDYVEEPVAEAVAFSPVDHSMEMSGDENYDNSQRTTELYQGSQSVEPSEDLEATSFFDLNRLNEARSELEGLNFHTGDDENDDERIPSDIPESGEKEEEAPAVNELSEVPIDDETLREFLNNIGLNLDRFVEDNNESLENVISILKEVSPKTIEDNYELLRSINVSNEVPYIIYEGHSYLADSDLAKKVTLLRAKNISESVIKKLLSERKSGLRKDLKTIEDCVNSIENSFGKLTDDNVEYLVFDMENYFKNYSVLQNNGFELEEKELRNYFAVLLEAQTVAEDIEVLKSYLISIVKKNGKYALSVFWKNPTELMRDIDTLIEAGIENAISSNPEGLSRNVNEILKRVKYCKEQDHPVFEEDGTICEYITDFNSFQNHFGNVKLPDLDIEKASNQELPRIIGNEEYTEIFINTLNTYYSSAVSRPVEIDEDVRRIYEELKQQIVEKLSATPTGKYTYKVENVCISKNKFERNLALLLNALANSGQSPEGVERELILVAALYDLRQDDETKERLVSECLGFNNRKIKGGIKL